ncbi:hypothetical protein ACFYZN_34635 [Streptomyces sp. NPDC001777]|uniref:hypothetical protein n=1 Tax=Streptomyces sp. NPDC001777 TaxID=3364608 RepID=UPI00369EBC11
MLELVLIGLVLAIPAGLLMLYLGVRQPPPWHKQPAVLLGAALTSASLAAMAWGFGIFSGGLDVQETCELTLHITYDQAWRDRTGADGTSYFPLSNACNEHIDLVPAWVNPAIVALAVLAVGALVLAFFRIASAILRKGN